MGLPGRLRFISFIELFLTRGITPERYVESPPPSVELPSEFCLLLTSSTPGNSSPKIPWSFLFTFAFGPLDPVEEVVVALATEGRR